MPMMPAAFKTRIPPSEQRTPKTLTVGIGFNLDGDFPPVGDATPENHHAAPIDGRVHPHIASIAVGARYPRMLKIIQRFELN